jgi:hypothetical protein
MLTISPGRIFVQLLGVLLLSPCSLSWGASGSAHKELQIMGWLESVFLQPYNVRATAKLDTGAKTSSVHADQIEHFTKAGETWVRFEFKPDKDENAIVVERPLVRKAVIKERLSRSSTREVVKLTICKNGHEFDTEFTLNNRSNFNYPILLGRSFLADVVLVDSSQTFMFKGESDPCSSKSPKSP